MLTPATVQALLDEHGISPKKSLGQHFLADPNTARRIVALADVARRRPRRRDRAGHRLPDPCAARRRRHGRSRSSSTPRSRACSTRCSRTRACAPRSRSPTRSTSTGPRCSPTAGRGRACRTCPTTSRSRWWCGCSRKRPASIALLVMVQREVGERLAAGPGDEQYGAVSVKVAYYAEAAVVGVVPPTVFVPRPKVESVLVQMRRRAGAAGHGAVGGGAVHPGARRASPSAARCCAARWCRCSATAPRPCSRTPASSPRPGPRCSGSNNGPRSPGAQPPREHRTGPGHGVPEAHAVAPRARSRAPTGSTTSRRSSSPSASPTTCSRRTRSPHRAACGSSSGRVTPATTSRPITPTSRSSRPRSSWCAPVRSGHGVRLVLRKRIPAGAGLGGGSADAAAALLAVRRLLEMDVDDAAVREIAADVGSDVPFCFTGGAAWMRGRGEIIEPLDLARGLAFLVAIPPFRLATPAVYAAWDDLGGPRRAAIGARAAPRRQARPRARQRPRAGGRSRRAPPGGVPCSRSKPRRASGAARGQRVGLRGAGAGRAGCCPSWCRRCGQRLRVPVVGHDERVARRAARSLTIARADRHAAERGSWPSGPAGDAASACASAASCASSCACACAAS